VEIDGLSTTARSAVAAKRQQEMAYWFHQFPRKIEHEDWPMILLDLT